MKNNRYWSYPRGVQWQTDEVAYNKTMKKVVEILSPEMKASCLAFAKNLTAGCVKWKDNTSNRQGDSEHVSTNFVTYIAGIRISVHIGSRLHDITDYCYVNCLSLNIEHYRLQGNTAEEVTTMAIEHCKEKVEELHKAFRNLGTKVQSK